MGWVRRIDVGARVGNTASSPHALYELAPPHVRYAQYRLRLGKWGLESERVTPNRHSCGSAVTIVSTTIVGLSGVAHNSIQEPTK